MKTLADELVTEAMMAVELVRIAEFVAAKNGDTSGNLTMPTNGQINTYGKYSVMAYKRKFRSLERARRMTNLNPPVVPLR